MANLTIKPSSTADKFIMTDANSSANTILTIDGQSDSGVTTAGRIIYGKGVNETLGTCAQTAGVVELDLGTGTFFEFTTGGENITTWKILHLPPAGTIAAWVVKITQGGTARTNAWTGNAASTYDDGDSFEVCLPVFHWETSDPHVMSTGTGKVDIIAFWTKGGDNPVIYTTTVGQDFLL